MRLINSPARYGAIPQALHWLTFLCVIAAWPLGWFLDDFPKGEARSLALLTHMTLGQCVFVLIIIRLVWRLIDPVPPLERTPLGPVLEQAGRLSHYAFYVLLVAVPIAGIVVQLQRGHPLPIFGLWQVPSPWPADRATAHTVLKIHEYLANTVVILAGIHAAAALIHHYGFRDRTLVRMLPGAN